MRQLLTPATVTLSEHLTPATVSWGPSGQPRRAHRQHPAQPRSVARVLDRWRYDGRWWEGEISRDYYLVELVDGVRLELFQEGGSWWLSKMSD